MIAEALRLNLGGAGEGFLDGRIPGFKTVDLRSVKATDIVSDVKNLSFCEDASVAEIYASNILEHFPHTETVSVLKEWCRVLIPKGKLWLSVPDFEACVRIYNQTGLAPWLQYLLWGDQKHPQNFHYINFTFQMIGPLLVKAGFSDYKRVDHLPFGIKDASEHRANVDDLPICLNLEVTK